MKSVSRRFDSRSGYLIFFQHLSCYFSLDTSVSRSDDEPKWDWLGNSSFSMCMFLFSVSCVRCPWLSTKHKIYWNAHEQLSSKTFGVTRKTKQCARSRFVQHNSKQLVHSFWNLFYLKASQPVMISFTNHGTKYHVTLNLFRTSLVAISLLSFSLSFCLFIIILKQTMVFKKIEL